MAIWEYAVIPLKGDLDSDKNTLDMYGIQGWELVSVAQIGGAIAYFKREKK
jgi:hypothetical protein